MTRVIHIDGLGHLVDKSSLFACQYLFLILLVTMLHPSIHNKDTHYSLSKHLLLTIPDPWPHLYSLKARLIATFKLNHQLPSRKILSHLTLLFSVQSTFRERRFIIHIKYFRRCRKFVASPFSFLVID